MNEERESVSCTTLPPHEAVLPADARWRDVVTDKGFHSNASLTDLTAIGLRTYISEPDRGRRRWRQHPDARAAVYANRRRIRGRRGLALLRTYATYAAAGSQFSIIFLTTCMNSSAMAPSMTRWS